MLPVRNFEQAQGFIDVAGFKGPAAVDGELFAGDDVGVEGDVAGVGVLAEDEVLAAVAGEFYAFVHGGGVADAFDDEIGAEAAGVAEDEFAAGFRGGDFGDIDDDVGAEVLGHGEAVGGAADGDDFAGAALAGDGDGGEADRTGALDDDGVAPGDGQRSRPWMAVMRAQPEPTTAAVGMESGSLKMAVPARRWICSA